MLSKGFIEYEGDLNLRIWPEGGGRGTVTEVTNDIFQKHGHQTSPQPYTQDKQLTMHGWVYEYSQ